MTRLFRLAKSALELRSEFDQAFASAPPELQSEHAESLLAIRLGRDPYAIRTSEIAGLVSYRKIVPLPTPIPELVGVAGIRGNLVPVYNLAALLGSSPEFDRGRWLALCGTEELVGLAFSDLEGYFKASPVQVYAAGGENVIPEHIKGAVRTGDLVRAVINLPSVIETVKRRCGERRVSKER